MGTDRDFIFAVDLDGVVFRYTEGLARVVENVRGLPDGSLPEPTDWHFSNWNLAKGEFSGFHKQFVVDGRGFAYLDAFTGASEALWRLSDAGVYIRILTHRLGVPGQHSLIAADTVTCLETHNIPYRDLCFMESKADLAADVYVDDGPHNIEALTEAGRDIIIFDQLYNRRMAGVRAQGWTEVEALVMKRYQDWKSGASYV